MSNEPTVNIKAFKGIYNRDSSRRLPSGALENAINVDIERSGAIIRRKGFTLDTALTNASSAYSTKDEQRLFIVDDGNLILHGVGTLATGLGSSYVYWTEVANFVLLSTGHIVSPSNEVSLWRVPTPVITSVLSSGDTHQYQIVATYTDRITGREGGASAVEIVTSDSLPAVTVEEKAGYMANVYISEPDGTTLFLNGMGESLDQAQVDSHPVPDNIGPIAYHDGRLFAAEIGEEHSIIWMSVPHWWNLFRLREDLLLIPSAVTSLTGTREGLLITTNSALYLFKDDTLVQLTEYGTPVGEPVVVTDSGAALVWTNQGMCQVSPFRNVTGSKVSVEPGERCYVQYIEDGGNEKVVVLTDGNGVADNAR